MQRLAAHCGRLILVILVSPSPSLSFSQVLKGDIRPAIETHEMLYQVTKKHNFLPEVTAPPTSSASLSVRAGCFSPPVSYVRFVTLCLLLPPQAFTTDFRVHWAQHPLRPEFAESTYFLYKVSALSACRA